MAACALPELFGDVMETENVLVPQSASGATIRSVEPGRAVEWLGAGFRAFTKTPAFWAVSGVIIIVASWMLSMFPLLGSALSTAFTVVATGALMRAHLVLDNGGDPAAEAQKAASSQPLWILGALCAAATFGVAMTMVFMGLSSVGMFMISSGTLGPMILVSLVMMLAFAALITMAFWLAPALVALRGASPVEAIKLSFAASLKNLLPFVIFFVLATLACMATVITLGLAMIVVLPALIAATYAAYKEIFPA